MPTLLHIGIHQRMSACLFELGYRNVGMRYFNIGVHANITSHWNTPAHVSSIQILEYRNVGIHYFNIGVHENITSHWNTAAHVTDIGIQAPVPVCRYTVTLECRHTRLHALHWDTLLTDKTRHFF